MRDRRPAVGPRSSAAGPSQYAEPVLILGIVIVLVAIFAGAFIHPLLFLIGLSVIIVALVAD